jgi:glutathione-regulated potassium-efflux system ancillary protein KefG
MTNSFKNRVLILFAHPASHKSRVNSKMTEGVSQLDGITFHNLYEEYPDFQIDVKREQQLLIDHDIIIWHHPFYWYSSPAILKEWIDLVLEYGFAYGKDGTALKGKMVMTAITTGSRRESYEEGGFNQHTIQQFLAPFSQTARLCNMNYLPPFVVHGSNLLDEEGIEQVTEDYRKVMVSLRDEMFDNEELMKYDYMNDLLAVSCR